MLRLELATLSIRTATAAAALFDERARVIESGDFFGASEQLFDCTFETWAPPRSSLRCVNL
jgi:hypothetical protein